jgi:hypothetical protein
MDAIGTVITSITSQCVAFSIVCRYVTEWRELTNIIKYTSITSSFVQSFHQSLYVNQSLSLDLQNPSSHHEVLSRPHHRFVDVDLARLLGSLVRVKSVQNLYKNEHGHIG